MDTNHYRSIRIVLPYITLYMIKYIRNILYFLKVEVPSQFMENWLYDWQTMQSVSGHYKTEEVLPREIFDRVVACK